MTPTIDLLRSHRSIRRFTDAPITDEQRAAIIASAQAASSSSFLQCSSIIRITDKSLREQLVALTGGQKHVAQAAEFWIFCADFNRHLQICPEAQLGLAEQLLLGVVDTALLAQNAFTAAESLGLGGVYIGGIRNSIETVTELLALPKHVLPLFGLCLGWPDEDHDIKPRMPAAMVVHENSYSPSTPRYWRSMTKRWRSTIFLAVAMLAVTHGVTTFVAPSLKKTVLSFSIICISRVGQRAKLSSGGSRHRQSIRFYYQSPA